MSNIYEHAINSSLIEYYLRKVVDEKYVVLIYQIFIQTVLVKKGKIVHEVMLQVHPITILKFKYFRALFTS